MVGRGLPVPVMAPETLLGGHEEMVIVTSVSDAGGDTVVSDIGGGTTVTGPEDSAAETELTGGTTMTGEVVSGGQTVVDTALLVVIVMGAVV